MPIGGHQSAAAASDTWLTPPHITAPLGVFDLDPCAALENPRWVCERFYTVADNGLNQPWTGRVWCNPPYGAKTAAWLARCADHGNAVALVFARTETDMFFEYVWQRANALLFLRGRLHFYFPHGRASPTNAGGPSVLVAYGVSNAAALERCGIPGKFINLTQEVIK